MLTKIAVKNLLNNSLKMKHLYKTININN